MGCGKRAFRPPPVQPRRAGPGTRVRALASRRWTSSTALGTAGGLTEVAAATPQPRGARPVLQLVAASGSRQASDRRGQRHNVELACLRERLVPRLTSLQANRVKERTQITYLAILERLVEYLQYRTLPQFSAAAWDPILVDFIERRYDQQESREATVRVLYALLWASPHLGGVVRSCFPQAWASVQGWTRLSPPATRPPLPQQAAHATASKLLGFSQERAALGCVVRFETYCRVGEVLALRMFQIVAPDLRSKGAAGCPTIVLNASELHMPSKTGEMDSSIAFDLQEHRWVGMPLVAPKNAFQDKPMEHVVNVSYGVFLGLLERAVQELGISALQPTPHCFRHGGASHDRAAGRRPLQEVQRRGMWKVHSSGARYDKHGRGGLQLQLLPAPVRDALEYRTSLVEHDCRSRFNRLYGPPGSSASSSSCSQVVVSCPRP